MLIGTGDKGRGEIAAGKGGKNLGERGGGEEGTKRERGVVSTLS